MVAADPFGPLRDALPEICRALSRADVDCEDPGQLVNALVAVLALAIERAAASEQMDPLHWPQAAARVAANVPTTVAQLSMGARLGQRHRRRS